MADYGVNENGFKRKPREQIVDDLISSAKNVFGDDLNTSDKNPLIKLIKIISYPISLAWFGMESLYNSQYINTAKGQSLDYIAKFIGLERQEATKAVGNADFEGDEGTTIPEGFEVQTSGEESIKFETTESKDIESDGSVNIDIQALETGEEGNVPPDTITEIVNPISGLDSVTNPFETSGGSDEETDFELRERYKDSVSMPGVSTIDSIRGVIRELDNVNNAKIKENHTNTTDEDGLPPKSFEAIVLGGYDEEIAQTIFDSKAAGIATHGDTTITVKDDADNSHDVSFSRPSENLIYVDISVTTGPAYPDTGDTKLKNEVIKYIGGTDSDGDEWSGLGIGENVIYTKIIDVLYNVDGVDDVEVYIGTSDDPSGTSNIAIGDYEIAETSIANVDVNS